MQEFNIQCVTHTNHWKEKGIFNNWHWNCLLFGDKDPSMLMTIKLRRTKYKGQKQNKNNQTLKEM
jgi:hypothetical protein